MQKYRCSICGFVYDEARGIPDRDVAPGTLWADIAEDFACPICRAAKRMFQPVQDSQTLWQPTQATQPAQPAESTQVTQPAQPAESISAKPESTTLPNHRELSAAEISAVFSNLAKGCEKQRKLAEMDAFNQLADYFWQKAKDESDANLSDIQSLLDTDISSGLPTARTAAEAEADRGALRSLVWSEKVSLVMKSLLDLYAADGEAMLRDTKVFVCEICGYIHIGNSAPELCPVCKVPSFKITEVERS
ncbi:MAG: rubredoxin [Coriobacteriia bacterium]|nr:rubredoxin [Coriobacteriia bacterium]